MIYRILALDPGKNFAIVIVDYDSEIDEDKMVAYVMPKVIPGDDVSSCSQVSRYIEDTYNLYRPQSGDFMVAAEDITKIMNFSPHGGSMYLAYSFMQLMVKAYRDRVPSFRVYPNTLKKHTTGSGTASKDDMKVAMEKRYGLNLKAKESHVADALAVAAWVVDTHCREVAKIGGSDD